MYLGFYVMYRLICLKRVLKATIHRVALDSVKTSVGVVLAIADTDDDIFWRAIFCLLRAVFLAFEVLGFCNTTSDKKFYLIHCADQALKKLKSILVDDVVFGLSDNCFNFWM